MESATMDRPGTTEPATTDPATEPATDDNQNGQSPPQDPGEDQTTEPAEPQDDGGIVVQGTSQLSWDVGGKKPNTSSLRIVGGKVDVEGQFKKGQKFQALVDLEVKEVGFVDQVDASTGQVIGCDRRQKARIIGISIPE